MVKHIIFIVILLIVIILYFSYGKDKEESRTSTIGYILLFAMAALLFSLLMTILDYIGLF